MSTLAATPGTPVARHDPQGPDSPRPKASPLGWHWEETSTTDGKDREPMGHTAGASPHGARTRRRTLPQDVADALRSARLTLGLSVRQEARMTGVSPSMISHLEHARRAPSKTTAQALTNTLGEIPGLWESSVDDAGRDRQPW